MSTHEAVFAPAPIGEIPDRPAARSSVSSAGGEPAAARTQVPLDLPRLVMRRAAWVAVAGLLLALVLGLVRTRYDTGEEIDGALRLASASQALAATASRSASARDADAQAIDALRSLGSLRHLRLEIDDAAGQPLFRSAPPPPPGLVLGGLLKLQRLVFDAPTPASVSSTLQRPSGAEWSVRYIATPASEQREALSNLVDLLALLAGCCVAMLLVMHHNVRRAFRPLQSMLAAIARVEQHDLKPVRALDAMPIRELDAIAAALKHLAAGLEDAEAARRVLGHKVLTLQEEERQRIARDLHDEFGQRLTALRVDAAWLAKRLAGEAEPARVVAGMIEQCSAIQQQVRGLLARLHPLAAHGVSGERARSLKALLESLVVAWSNASPAAPSCSLKLLRGPADAPTLMPEHSLDSLRLPSDLMLALYRITQEALTNVARHAEARSAQVCVCITHTSAFIGAVDWSVEDDGRGLPGDAARAWQQGNGLAGIQERIWALGGELHWQAVQPAAPAMASGRGLRLAARIPFTLPAESNDSASSSSAR